MSLKVRGVEQQDVRTETKRKLIFRLTNLRSTVSLKPFFLIFIKIKISLTFDESCGEVETYQNLSVSIDKVLQSLHHLLSVFCLLKVGVAGPVSFLQKKKEDKIQFSLFVLPLFFFSLSRIFSFMSK